MSNAASSSIERAFAPRPTGTFNSGRFWTSGEHLQYRRREGNLNWAMQTIPCLNTNMAGLGLLPIILDLAPPKTEWVTVDTCDQCGHQTFEEQDKKTKKKTGKDSRADLPCGLICIYRRSYQKGGKAEHVNRLFTLFNEELGVSFLKDLVDVCLSYFDMCIPEFTSSKRLTMDEFRMIWPSSEWRDDDPLCNNPTTKTSIRIAIVPGCECNWCHSHEWKDYPTNYRLEHYYGDMAFRHYIRTLKPLDDSDMPALEDTSKLFC